ncbi:hypothetical protein FO519_004626 [Halicephalobus sp. NKZ332]|nr:hypothetical protein FO519_004626 [Halicephalobus sp. NKZ332]
MKVLLLIVLFLPFVFSCDDYEYTCHNASKYFTPCRFSCPGNNCNYTCPLGFFRCGPPQGIPSVFSSITSALISETFYQIHTYRCIPISKVGDGNRDCPGGEDEEPYIVQIHNKTICGGGFRCNVGSLCLEENFFCDGKSDCPGGEDERNCGEKYKNLLKNITVENYLTHEVHCTENEFNCGEFCIPKTWKSDGQVDCQNKKDEENTVGESFKCSAGFFRCPMEPKCIENGKICDEYSDCLGAHDEINCKFKCSEGKFRCNNGQCIDRNLRCDGTIDCKDGTDEYNCLDRNYRNENIFVCRKSDIHIFSGFLCDGNPDCPDNSDEKNCTLSPNCGRNHFECKRSKICIPSIWKCDGEKDCPDGSDEAYCNSTSVSKCPRNLKLCQDGSCKKICPSNCDPDYYTCPDGECIKFSELCFTAYCKNSSICDSNHTIYGCDITRDENCQVEVFSSGVTVHRCEGGFSNFWNRGCESENEILSVNYYRRSPIDDLSMYYDMWAPGYVCFPGFRRVYNIVLNEVGLSRIRADTGYKAELLLTTPDQFLKFNFYEKKLEKIENLSEDTVASTTYYLKNETLIWSSLKTKKIMKCYFPFLKRGENPENFTKCQNTSVLVSNVVSYYMALDWVHGLLYFVNEGGHSITVVNFLKENPISKTVIQGSFQHFRGLQVDPSLGLLFFIASGKIYRAGLGGSNLTALTEDFHRPTSMFLDIYGKRVYFSDTKRGRIFSINYLGRELKKHFTSRAEINPIYSIAIFEGDCYFNDQKGLYFFSPQKDKYPQKIAESFGYPIGLQVIHETAQPEFINKCRKNNCEDFCFPINSLATNLPGNKSFTCGCRNGFEIQNGTSCVFVEKEKRELHIETTTWFAGIPVRAPLRIHKYPKYNVEGIFLAVSITVLLLILFIGIIFIIKKKSSKKITSESPVSFNDLRMRDQTENKDFNPASKILLTSFGNPCFNDTVKSETS